MATPKPARIVFLNLSEHYGAGMTFSELSAALAGQESNPALRAVLQLLRYQMGVSRTHELSGAAGVEERAYGAGSARAAEQTLEWIHDLVKHQPESVRLREIAAQFPDPKLKPAAK